SAASVADEPVVHDVEERRDDVRRFLRGDHAPHGTARARRRIVRRRGEWAPVGSGRGTVRLSDMALFSRRKKTDDAPSEPQNPTQADAAEDVAEEAQPPSEPVPEVAISVQAFRGVGADAAPEIALTDDEAEPSAEPVARPNAATEPHVPAAAAGPRA